MLIEIDQVHKANIGSGRDHTVQWGDSGQTVETRYKCSL